MIFSSIQFCVSYNLTIMEARLKKYENFDPSSSKWGHDKRSLEDATNGLEVLVAKNFSKYALPCFAIYPDVDFKAEHYRGFNVVCPDGPIKDYFNQQDTKKSSLISLEILVLMIWPRKMKK